MMRRIRQLLLGWIAILVGIYLLPVTNHAFAATVSSKTPAEVVAFLREDMRTCKKDYGAGLCLGYISDVYGKMGFDTRYGLESAINYWRILESEGKAHYDPLSSVPIGADVFFNSGANFGSYGHVGIYIGSGTIIHNRTIYDAYGNVTEYGVVEQEIASNSYYTSCYLGWAWHDWVTITDEVRGSEMTSGYDCALPDGDYLIASAATTDKSSFYYLDIVGDNAPADQTNVQLWGPVSDLPPAADIWTITYNPNDKFYTIKQKGTNICLDVYNANTLQGTNVWACTSNDSSAQKWAIQQTGSGYALRPKCSGGGNDGMCLDVANGTMASGTEVRMWKGNRSAAQTWLFIPYEPSQFLEDGRYILLSGVDNSWELDVPGNTGDVEDRTPVQLWSDDAYSQYNSFDITKLSNGYYRIIHSASGKALEVYGGGSSVETNISLLTPNGSNAQQWAITKDGYNNGYLLRVKSSGFAMDLAGAELSNGARVRQYFWNGSQAETWRFVKAEYTITYNLNGGTDGPENQIKYYNNELQLSPIVPKKAGCIFVGWDSIVSGTTQHFQPGDSILTNADLTLTAIWESATYTIIYDANGGTGKPDGESKTVNGGGAITLSTSIPNREGYDFLGWAISSTASEALYQPGSTYPGGTATLYAVWRIKQFHVTFDSVGAEAYDSRTINYGETLGELPEPSKDRQFFKGWIDANGNKVSANTIVKSDLALTALWSTPTKLVLPSALTVIEDEAFENNDMNIVVIPSTVTSIGSKAFANNKELHTAIIYSTSVTPASDAFSNCQNLTIYGYSETPLYYFASAKQLAFVSLDSVSEWVDYSELPIGATITAEKWTYTEVAESSNSVMPGWEQAGFEWRKTTDGIWTYANYPSGFSTNHAL